MNFNLTMTLWLYWCISSCVHSWLSETCPWILVLSFLLWYVNTSLTYSLLFCLSFTYLTGHNCIDIVLYSLMILFNNNVPFQHFVYYCLCFDSFTVFSAWLSDYSKCSNNKIWRVAGTEFWIIYAPSTCLFLMLQELSCPMYYFIFFQKDLEYSTFSRSLPFYIGDWYVLLKLSSFINPLLLLFC